MIAKEEVAGNGEDAALADIAEEALLDREMLQMEEHHHSDRECAARPARERAVE